MKIVIKRTDGGVSIMTAVMDLDLDLDLAARIEQWKSSNPGLYVSHREMPDDAIPADRTFRDAWTDTTSGLVIDIDLSRAKAAKIASFNGPFEIAAAQIKAGYPSSEVESWPIQEKEALAWDANNAELTPYIDSLASARGIPRDQYLIKTIAKVNAFRAASAAIIGKRQRLEDAAKAAATLDALRAIVW